MSTLIDSVYYELGVRTQDLEKGARRAVAADEAIEASAQKAEDAITELVEAMMQTPEGAAAMEQALQRLQAPLDRVSSGMSQAGSGSEKFALGLRKLDQMQADTAARMAALNLPLDRITQGLSFASSGAAKWELGLRKLAVAQEQQRLASERQALATARAASAFGATLNTTTAAAGANTAALGKLRGGLVALALSATQTSGPVGQVVSALLILGIGGGAVTGIAAGIALLGTAYDKLTRKTREAKEETQKLITELYKASRQGVSETTTAQRGLLEGAVNDLQAQLDEDNRKKKTLNAATALSPDDRKDLERRLREARIALGKFYEESLSGSELPEVESIAPTIEQVQKRITDRFTDALPATIEATTQAIVGLAAALTAAGTPATEVDKALGPLVARLQELRTQAENGEIASALSLGPEQALEKLDELRQRLVDTLGADQTTAEAQRTVGQIAEIDAARARVSLQIVDANRQQADASAEVLVNTEGSNDSAIQLRSTTSEIVQQVANVARGAIGVAQAFGLASDNAAAMLQNVVTVADGLNDVTKQLGNIGKKDGNGNSLFNAASFAGGTIAVLGGIAGMVSGLFGESAATKRAREIQEHNTRALEELGRTIGEFGLGITGASFASGRRGVGALLQGGIEQLLGSSMGALDMGAVRGILTSQGTSLRELKDLAKELGITLNTDNAFRFIESLEALNKAIAETQLVQFAQTFAGQLQALRDEFELFDITNPLEQLQKLVGLATGSIADSDILQQILGGLDLADPSQRAEAERRLLDLFRQLNDGSFIGREGELGNLTPEELRDLLKQIEAAIDAVNKQDGSSSGGGPIQETFGITRGVTEVTGNRLAGLLESQDAHLVEIRDLLARALQPVGLIPAPAYPVDGTRTAGGGGIVIQVTNHITITGGMTTTQAASLGAAFGRGNAAEIDRQLGHKYRQKKLLTGQTRSR